MQREEQPQRYGAGKRCLHDVAWMCVSREPRTEKREAERKSQSTIHRLE